MYVKCAFQPNWATRIIMACLILFCAVCVEVNGTTFFLHLLHLYYVLLSCLWLYILQYSCSALHAVTSGYLGSLFYLSKLAHRANSCLLPLTPPTFPLTDVFL